ncbi:MAG: type II secretion system minor pseudopilin GspJ [Gammaproteobacteria bacterium]|nr:type II secretion system minor pseudopilin GspJ [Gammaproteobacteria bacterium]
MAILRQRGFTLIELLVAITVFAIMSAMAYGGLRTLLDSRDRTRASAEALNQLQNSFLLLHQDLGQSLPRGVRDQFGDQEAPFVGNGTDDLLFSLTRGDAAGELIGRPGLRRIAYRHKDQRLERLIWPVLDRVQGTEPAVTTLMEPIDSADVRFLGENWAPFWPPSAEKAQPAQLPKALKITLHTQKWGAITRLFVIKP